MVRHIENKHDHTSRLAFLSFSAMPNLILKAKLMIPLDEIIFLPKLNYFHDR